MGSINLRQVVLSCKRKLTEYKLASELGSKQHPPVVPVVFIWQWCTSLVGGIAVWKSKQDALSSCLHFPMMGHDLEIPSLQLLLVGIFYHRNKMETRTDPILSCRSDVTF